MFPFTCTFLLSLAWFLPTQAFAAHKPPIYRWEVRGTSQQEPDDDRPWSVTYSTLVGAEKDLKETH
ncbi:MAG: hypothetical protein KDA84_11940, partial [Planctomycetaceae bacterium]|nr:hypothetical protein [Planctomycetaceae bacterium]